MMPGNLINSTVPIPAGRCLKDEKLEEKLSCYS
ncbi:hypothetical protein J2Z42_001582 [Clostridium algifaecis]|uniref:Uncharacterized protein n=1 Tax=Clostridium algifaecis TaxID=1472040 RepID=A0ABS4KS89_9CLOT|nr:hypothetical protein [Clostridium algifaecis]